MFEQRFLNRVDVRREPIKRTVQSMVRLRAPDYYTNKGEGVDWREVPVNPVNEHVQGVYTKHFTKQIYGQKGGNY